MLAFLCYYYFFSFSLLPLAHNRAVGNHSNRNPSTSNNQRTILFLIQNQVKKKIIVLVLFCLCSALNVMHCGHLCRPGSFWGRWWCRWLIAGGSRGCTPGQESHSQFKPAAMFYLPLPAAESLQEYLRIALLGWAGLLPQPTKATLCFVMTHVPQLSLFLPVFSPLLGPKITLLSDF